MERTSGTEEAATSSFSSFINRHRHCSAMYVNTFFAGRRLWVLLNPAIPVQIRSVACDGGATLSTPGNSTVAPLPAPSLMARRHRVIGHCFECGSPDHIGA